MSKRTFRAAALFLSVCFSAVSALAADEGLYPPELRLPEVDPGSAPSQVAYADWPPAELLRRGYWLPWSELAFNRAALFGRPILFVMTTGWSGPSRQMVEETLASETVLANLNLGYVTVLVNADRRPDLKERYQTGTWPVVAWLLPNGLPMLSQANDLGVARPITAGNLSVDQMLFLLVEGDKYWKKWPELLLGVASEWAEREGETAPNVGPVDEVATDQVEAWLLGNADAVHGGFGAAPKFVVAGLHEYARIRDARLRPALKSHSRKTLELLVASPLFDGTEGGVHRMAALPDWGGIQPEKMLLGNALLLRDLYFALLEKPSDSLRRAARLTADFITTVLARPGGGFYLAEGAPSHFEPNTSAPAETPRPVDPQVLSGPNALAGAALIRIGILLEDESLVTAGRDALDLVLRQGLEPGRGARHVIEPNPNPRIFLTAQADVALGFADAYETTGDRAYLDAAHSVVDFAIRNLHDPGRQDLNDHLREKDALGLLSNPRRPLTPNVRIARAARRLQLHGQGERYRELAGQILGSQSNDLTPFAVHATEAALGIEEWIRDPMIVTIDGPPGETTRALRRAAVLSPWPWTVVTTGDASAPPAATITFANRTETVTDPRRIAEIARGFLTGE
jgi:uncharacterized protein YyaL (SSP411 family)